MHQNLHQDCTFDAMSVLGWFSVNFISLFLTVINDRPTITYKPEFRTVDPKVEGSSPFGLAEALSVQGAGKAFFFTNMQPVMVLNKFSSSNQFRNPQYRPGGPNVNGSVRQSLS